MLILAATVLCLTFASCGATSTGEGSVSRTDVPTNYQESLWNKKVEEIGVTVENKKIVCYHGEDEYLEFLTATYENGKRVSEQVCRIYYDKWWYENKGKPELKDKEGFVCDDEVLYVEYKSSLFEGATYAEDLKAAAEELTDRYTIKY